METPILKITARRDKDPTFSKGITRRWFAEIQRRFDSLSQAVIQYVYEENQLGGRVETTGPLDISALAEKYVYEHSPEKAKGFISWLDQQVADKIMEVEKRPWMVGQGYGLWTDVYIHSAYQKGVEQARADLNGGGAKLPDLGPVSYAMNKPFHADRLGLIYSRTFNGMKGITESMKGQMSGVLAMGMAEGRSPYDIAYKLKDRVDAIITRARLIARTEVVHTHNEAAMNEFESLEGIVGETIYVQWWTALDERVRATHAARHGKVFKRKTAQGLIGEPNCRCALLPWTKTLAEARKVISESTSFEQVPSAGDVLVDKSIVIKQLEQAEGYDVFGKPGGNYIKNPIPSLYNIGEKLEDWIVSTDDWVEARVGTVKLSSLRNIQNDVRKDGVLTFLREKGVVPKELPVVIQYKGYNVVWDGNHRLSAKLLAGEESAKVIFAVPDDKRIRLLAEKSLRDFDTGKTIKKITPPQPKMVVERIDKIKTAPEVGTVKNLSRGESIIGDWDIEKSFRKDIPNNVKKHLLEVVGDLNARFDFSHLKEAYGLNLPGTKIHGTLPDLSIRKLDPAKKGISGGATGAFSGNDAQYNIYLKVDMAFGNDRITLGQMKSCADSLSNTFRHELAHGFDSRQIYAANRHSTSFFGLSKEVATLYDTYKESNVVSVYARTNKHEFFAECFSCYTNPNYGVVGKTLPSDVEKFFEKWLPRRK